MIVRKQRTELNYPRIFGLTAKSEIIKEYKIYVHQQNMHILYVCKMKSHSVRLSSKAITCIDDRHVCFKINKFFQSLRKLQMFRVSLIDLVSISHLLDRPSCFTFYLHPCVPKKCFLNGTIPSFFLTLWF